MIAETVPADVDERVDVRIVGAAATGDSADATFPWARLGSPALLRHAHPLGWCTADQWTAGGRSFVALRSRSTSSSAEAPNSRAVISSHRGRKPLADSPVADA